MLSRLTNTIIGVVLFAGFTLINYLASTDSLYLISPNAQSYIIKFKYIFYAIIIVVYIFQQLLRDLPKPVSTAEVQELRPVIMRSLENALNYYASMINDMGFEIPPVRMNIMLKVRNNSYSSPRLRIVYSLGCMPDIDGDHLQLVHVREGCYSIEEEALTWKKGQGSCGQAYRSGHICIYDSENSMYQSPITHLDDRQKDLTREIKSVLSMPLWLNKKIIGVLNIDSTRNITQTQFVEKDVTKNLDDYVELLSKICAIFKDGLRI